MAQFNYPEMGENRIKDVGVIENCVYSQLMSQQRKEHSLLYHLLYAVFAGILGYLAVDSGILGTFAGVGTLAMFLFPALFSYTLLFSPMFCKALGTLLPLVLYGVRFFAIPMAYDGYESFVLSSVTYFMCFVTAVVFCVTAYGRKTKLWCFTAVTAVTASAFLVAGLIFLIYTKGSADISLAVGMINDGINYMTATFKEALVQEFSDSSRFESFKLLIPEIGEMTEDTAASFLAETFKSSLSTLKMLIPSLFILSCMVYGFIFTGIFSLVAKYHKMPLFVCIMDRHWCYRIPSSCITFFDIILLFVIIGSIFGLPSSVAASVMNLLLIMLPVVTMATFKAIHFFLYGSLRSKAVAYLLCAVIAVVPMMFLGMWGYLLLCSLGVSFVAQRYRIEGEAAKVKIRSDTELMLIMCGLKEIPARNDGTQKPQTDGEETENGSITDNNQDGENSDGAH